MNAAPPVADHIALPIGRDILRSGAPIAKIDPGWLRTRLAVETRSDAWAEISDDDARDLAHRAVQLAEDEREDAATAAIMFDRREPGVPAPKRMDHAREPATMHWPQALDLEALARREPRPPRSIMQGLPVGYATLIAGHGGAGKSGIALYLAVCLALGRDFFGLAVQERSRVLYLSCEDRGDVEHWRLSRACAHLGVPMASLAGSLHVLDLVGRDATLWRADPRGASGLTVAYGELAERMRDVDVLIVDGINDTFAGSENDRGHVKAYVNALLALVNAERGALVLIGHVSKSAAGGFTAEGYSGSTAWHNAARARWYLRPEAHEAEDGTAERSGAMLLELQKANHGDAVSLRFKWDEAAHLFVGEIVGGASHFDRKHQSAEERAAILAAFRACAEASPVLIVPSAMTGPRTALHVLSARPEFPDSLRAGRPAARRFWRHIEELRQLRWLEECSYRRTNRHTAAQLVITAEGVRQCATC